MWGSSDLVFLYSLSLSQTILHQNNNNNNNNNNKRITFLVWWIKHGEYGATIFFREGAFGIGRHPFRAPTLPLEEVKDPTGAGDSFAGGFMGYIASQEGLNREVLKRALFYGGVMGSFAVEDFGTRRLRNLKREQIEERFEIFRELTHIE